MKSDLESSICLVPLTLSARIKAEQFSRNQSNPQKAQQVYQNTLVISAVNTYLNYSGWITSLSTSNSWNPIMQSLMDVADLDIPDYGKVECCFVDDKAEFLVISPEVRSNRIAYIAVSLETSLESAKIWGFVSESTENKIALSQLKSILDLPAYLAYWKQEQENKKLANYSITKLKQWLKGFFEEEWQTLDEIFFSTPSLNFRTSQQLQQPSTINANTLDDGISRVKLLNLASNQQCNSVALIVSLKDRRGYLDISVKVCPTNNNNYLPEGLEIFIVDRQQEVVMQAQAEQTKNIEFRFSGEPEEYFSIKVCFNKQTQVETFYI